MKKNNLVYTSVISFLVAMNGYAGTDPIAWSLFPSSGFPAQTTVGSTYAVSYTLSNNLPFPVPLTVSGKYNGGNFTLTNGCNTTLAAKNNPGSSCLVHVGFQPVKAGQNTAQLTMAYHNNRVRLPLLSSNATSAESKDLVNGQVTQPLPAVTYTGSSYNVTFVFVNEGPTPVTATAVNVSGFTPTTNTCTAQLNPGSPPCEVKGTFSPSSTGQATLSVTYVYNSGGVISVPLSTQTNVQSGGGTCHHINGVNALPLPVTTYIYSDNVIKIIFTNHCPTGSAILGQVTLSSDSNGGATINPGQDTCSNQTLAAGGTCNVFASVVPTATTSSNDLTITALLPYDNNAAIASTATSEAVNSIPNPTTQHTMMFVNQCDKAVWYEFQNGAGGTGPTRKSPDPVAGQSLEGYHLKRQLTGAAPSTKAISFNEYVNGAIYGRTGCNSTGQCTTANCPVITGTGTCQVSTQPTPPMTIFEGTLEAAPGIDGSYDVSMINGFNLAGEMRSLSPIVNPLNFSNACGQSGGAVIQPQGSSLGQCPWSFTPPNTTSPDETANYIWVSSGAENTSCTSGSPTCGMGFNADPPNNSQIFRREGTFQGYWTIANFFGYTSAGQWGTINLYNDYGLGNSLDVNKYGAGALVSYLYSCVETVNGSLLSGYAFTQNVCGCYDWNQSGSQALTAQASNCIVPSTQNPDWLSTVFNRILWLKQACPTAYSYPFDDTSTSFTCNVSGQKTSYQITYCPAGKTGAPGT